MLNVLAEKKILLVDDDRVVCQLLVEDITRSGCSVETAHTFDAARAALEKNAYDAAVIDVMGVRGFDLVTEYARKVPCIVLTARARRPEDLLRAQRAGAALYVPKLDIGRLDVYLAKVISAAEPLWPWLFEFYDFKAWFGDEWQPPLASAPGKLEISPGQEG
jgi:CheY-like chemotaxis protein